MLINVGVLYATTLSMQTLIRLEVVTLMEDLILATDISKHNVFMSQFEVNSCYVSAKYVPQVQNK